MKDIKPERKRYWILRLGLIALMLVPTVVGLAIAGDRVPGGPGGKT